MPWYSPRISVPRRGLAPPNSLTLVFKPHKKSDHPTQLFQALLYSPLPHIDASAHHQRIKCQLERNLSPIENRSA